ncbi:MAG: hypothetical protein HN726_05205 [Candidatus Magasanikbacteria bacterium]|jgi:hypothetical protein|nr:hypothetical protein [Candidatus Magasanikbacteria bacterium]
MRFAASRHLIRRPVPAVPIIMALAALLAAFLWLAPHSAAAEPGAGLNLELNKTNDSPRGCMTTLLIGNGLGQTLDRFRLDLVLFDAKNAPIDRLLIDLAPLPAGRTTIASLSLHDGPCANISRILLREIPACRGRDGSALDCLAGLVITTRSAIEFGR